MHCFGNSKTVFLHLDRNLKVRILRAWKVSRKNRICSPDESQGRAAPYKSSLTKHWQKLSLHSQARSKASLAIPEIIAETLTLVNYFGKVFLFIFNPDNTSSVNSQCQPSDLHIFHAWKKKTFWSLYTRVPESFLKHWTVLVFYRALLITFLKRNPSYRILQRTLEGFSKEPYKVYCNVKNRR